MSEKNFKHNGYNLSYLRIGSGEDFIFAFHGFGMDKYAFEAFHPLVKTNQSLISIDLFAHGNSTSSDFSGIKKEEWKLLFEHFLSELDCKKFSLLAYSLGGKIVLETVNIFPDRIKGLILLSPDGFKRNKFYQFLSLSFFGRWTYRRVLNSPNSFLKFVDFLTRFKFLPARLNKFVHYHISDKQRRELVYDVYRIYRHFIPNTIKFKDHIESQKIIIQFIFGKHDAVIHHSLAEKFIGQLNNQDLGKLHLLNKGHVILDSDTAAYLKKIVFGLSNF